LVQLTSSGKTALNRISASVGVAVEATSSAVKQQLDAFDQKTRIFSATKEATSSAVCVVCVFADIFRGTT
jgi:hypothetical protein